MIMKNKKKQLKIVKNKVKQIQLTILAMLIIHFFKSKLRVIIQEISNHHYITVIMCANLQMLQMNLQYLVVISSCIQSQVITYYKLKIIMHKNQVQTLNNNHRKLNRTARKY